MSNNMRSQPTDNPSSIEALPALSSGKVAHIQSTTNGAINSPESMASHESLQALYTLAAAYIFDGRNLSEPHVLHAPSAEYVIDFVGIRLDPNELHVKMTNMDGKIYDFRVQQGGIVFAVGGPDIRSRQQCDIRKDVIEPLLDALREKMSPEYTGPRRESPPL